MHSYFFSIATACIALSATAFRGSKVYPRTKSSSGVTIPLYATYTPYGTVLDAAITIGDQDFLLFLDTGSSDTWVANRGFQFNTSNGTGGTLSLGTLPNIAHKPTFAIAPVEIMAVIPPLFTNNIPQKSYWALTITRTTYASTTNTTPLQAIVDSGNFLNYIPGALALAANNAFSPPATRSADFEATGQYDVACNATAPRFGLQFSNNVTVFMDPRDMVVRNADGRCGSAVADADQIGASGGISFPILGTPWLRSVVAVFDFGADEMRFAEREDGNASAVAGGNATVGGSRSSTSSVAIPGSTASTLAVSGAGSKPVVSFVTLLAVVFLSVGFVL